MKSSLGALFPHSCFPLSRGKQSLRGPLPIASGKSLKRIKKETERDGREGEKNHTQPQTVINLNKRTIGSFCSKPWATLTLTAKDSSAPATYWENGRKPWLYFCWDGGDMGCRAGCESCHLIVQMWKKKNIYIYTELN